MANALGVTGIPATGTGRPVLWIRHLYGFRATYLCLTQLVINTIDAKTTQLTDIDAVSMVSIRR